MRDLLDTDLIEALRNPLLVTDERFDLTRKAAARLELLEGLLLRHQVAAWCEDDSDLAVETRAALAGKVQP